MSNNYDSYLESLWCDSSD